MIPLYNAIAVAMWGDDDDEYFKQTDYSRRNNLMLFVGGGYVRIPLPPVFRNIYALGDICYMAYHDLLTPGEVALTATTNLLTMANIEGPLSVRNFDPRDIARTLVPDVGVPIVEAIINKNFSGSKIYKVTPFNELDPGYLKAYPRTWKPLVDFSRFMNKELGGSDFRKAPFWGMFLNPGVAQHLITNYTGGIGQLIGDVVTNTSNYAQGKFLENFSWWNIPILKRFWSVPDESTTQNVRRRSYYDIKKEMEIFEHDLNGHRNALYSEGKIEYEDEYIRLSNSEENQLLYIFKATDKMIQEAEDDEEKQMLINLFMEQYGHLWDVRRKQRKNK
jgi:hypothetical protein